MDEGVPIWHLGDEAIFEYLDGALSPEARAEADRHLRACVACRRRLSEAQTLFGQIESLPEVVLEVDLAPSVIAGLQAGRSTAARWRWILAAQAVVAAIALGALSMQVQRWIDLVLHDPALVSVRQFGGQALAQLSGWVTPFLRPASTFSLRLGEFRLPVPHLEGPLAGWAALAALALVMGFLGNVLLMRSPDGAMRTLTEHPNGARPSGR